MSDLERKIGFIGSDRDWGWGDVKSWPRSYWNGHSPEKRPGGKPELPVQEKEKEKKA